MTLSMQSGPPQFRDADVRVGGPGKGEHSGFQVENVWKGKVSWLLGDTCVYVEF